jgi:hypothetical protein
LLRNFVCLLRVDLLFASSVSALRASFLIFAIDGGWPPKIASPLRRNMGAQIYVNFDRYISINAGTRANLFKKSIGMD